MYRRTDFNFWVGLTVMTLFLYGCPKKPPATDLKSKPTEEEVKIKEAKQLLEEEKKRFEEEKERLDREKGLMEAKKRDMADELRRLKKADEVQKRAVGDALPLAARSESVEVEEELALKDIRFDYNSFKILANAGKTLRQNAEWLLSNQDVKILIEGHCDERGTSEYNLALGEKRALATKKYLISLGVSANRLHTISYGEELPLNPGHNEAAWEENRRGHFLITSR